MTVIPQQSSLLAIDLAVPLPRYAKIIGYSECAFFGVSSPDNVQYSCREIWTKPQRDDVEKALAEAQQEIEEVLGYAVIPTYFVNEEHSAAMNPVTLDWGMFIEPGIKASEDISLGESVDHASDPATIGPVGGITCLESEIHIFFHDSDVEIFPSKLELVSGTLDIEIPRCRLVDSKYADNPLEGYDYFDVPNSQTSPFAVEVDIKRIYTDQSVNATLVHPSTNGACGCNCSETETTACIMAENNKLSAVVYRSAIYSNNVWGRTRSNCSCGAWKVFYNYLAGLPKINYKLEDSIIRLAHSKMASEPCGCDVVTRLWKRDRDVPDYLTRERMNCPFGLSNGAWMAYKFALSSKLWHMSNFMSLQVKA